MYAIERGERVCGADESSAVEVGCAYAVPFCVTALLQRHGEGYRCGLVDRTDLQLELVLPLSDDAPEVRHDPCLDAYVAVVPTRVNRERRVLCRAS